MTNPRIKTEQPQPAVVKEEKKNRNASPHDLVQDLQKVTGVDARDELKLAAQVESTLRAIYPCEVVKVEDGIFTVDVEAPLLWEDRLVEEYNAAAKQITGVKAVRVHLASSEIWGLG